MLPISLTRFNALAGYCRHPQTQLIAEELGWFEHGGERVLGILVRDRQDGDFGGMILGRDRNGRFRYIDGVDFHQSKRRIEALLRREMERLSMAPEEEYYQGDESGRPVDFFAQVAARERLNQGFIKLTEHEGFSPARGMIEPMMRWYEDPDGNFIEQFQTTGFDARLWELCLFAIFVEMGYRIERIHAIPDFECIGIPGEFVVEATTVNPTLDKNGQVVPPPPHNTPDDIHIFLREYMPIKFGSALTSKLGKKYWEKPNVAGKPLIFAIQDFSAPGSMVFTRSALPVYLYGYDYDWDHDNTGRLNITPRKVTEHRWNEKIIPSGFFKLPGAENVSAVLFSNSSTISKFNRMGMLAGFGSRRVILVRQGLAYDYNPNAAAPRQFRHVVNSPDYAETWVEGIDVFHNPQAKHPVEPWMLPGAAHHQLLADGQMESIAPDWQPLSSVTFITIAEEE